MTQQTPFFEPEDGPEIERLRAINAELLSALEATTNHLADVMRGPVMRAAGIQFKSGIEGIPTIRAAREIITKAKGE